MAIAAWLVWRKVGLTAAPMQLFLLQLLLNIAWSAVFFSSAISKPSLCRNRHAVVRHPGDIDRILESSPSRGLVALAVFDLG